MLVMIESPHTPTKALCFPLHLMGLSTKLTLLLLDPALEIALGLVLA